MHSLADIPSEYHCHRNFYKAIWGECTCSHCGSRKLRLRNNYEYCPECKHKTSVKAETIFKSSNLSFRQIYILIWCWQRCFGIREIVELMDSSFPTIRRWLERLRSTLEVSSELLGGEVEIDGSYFGRKKYGKQKLVVGVIECLRRAGEEKRHITLSIQQEKTREAVEDFVEDHIRSGSVVYTDGLQSYNQLPLLGYEWGSCDHQAGIFGPTNHIEALWSEIKRALRHMYRDLTFSYKQLNLVLREWENRHNNPELFYNVDSYLKLKACSKFVH